MSGIGEALLISAAASLVSAGLTYALTPTQKIEGSRLDSLTSGNSSYGSPLPWAWGTVRLPGNKIWLDYLEERKKTESQGGGFFGLAPKVETTTYNYFGYWAEIYCECPFRPVAGLQRNWMNKKLVYSTIGGAETIAKGGKFAEQYLRFYKGDPAQELDILLANKDSISSYSYGLPKNPSERDAFLRSYGIDPNTQDLTPAYNYRALSVWQRVPLGDFFNAIPAGEAELLASLNCTVAQIVGDIFSLFYKPERYDVSLLTTPVKGFTIDSINAAKSAIQTLQQAYFFDIVDSNGVYKFIPLNHPRDVIHLGIKDLAAHTGEQKPVDYEIIETDPASLPSKVTVKYIDPDLNYDTNQQDSQLEVKGHYNPNPTNLSFNLVLTASEAATIADRALILAWISKYTYKFQLPPAYLNLEPADLIANVFDDRDIPIKLTKLRLGANLIIDAEGVGHDPFFWNLVRQLEVGGVTLGVADYNIILQVSGTPTTVSDSAGTIYVEGTDYTVTSDGNVQILSSGNIPAGTNLVVATATAPQPDPVAQGAIVDAGPTELLVLDIPLIKNSHSDYTLYLTGGGGENWNGAKIYFSTDNSRYSFGGTLNGQGVYGECTTALGDTVTVEVNSPELESISSADLDLDLNLALVGNEIIQFKTASLSGRNIYTLSEITRGLRGTENERDNHSIGDRFVLLTGDSAELTPQVYQKIDIGEVRYFKAVSSGQSLDEVEPVTLTVQGVAQRPYAPVDLRATKNGVGDIFVEWDRRDRHDQRENPPTISEDEEKYLFAVVNTQTVVRSYSSNKNSTIYTANHQTADFGSIQSTITVRVAQVSSDVGNGSFATATLTPRLVEPEPTITSFSPASAGSGATITVTGADLASVTEVRIGDIVQNNLAVIDNQTIEFTIAPGTVSGNIELSTGGGTASSNGALIVEAQQTTPGHYLANDTEILPQQPNLKFTGNVSVTDDETNSTTIVDVIETSGGHEISDDTQAYPERNSLKFTGNVSVTDDEITDATIVEILTPIGSTSETFDTASITTQALNDGEFESIDLELPAVTAIRQIDVSQPSRIRLFGSKIALSADTADINTQLQEASGLILDKLISGSYQFARGIIATNCDDPIANFIYARIGNNSGSSGAIDVDLKYYAIATIEVGERFDEEEKAILPENGLQLWLDATDASTLTTSDQAVVQWNDKSGNNNHATQVSGLNYPKIREKALFFDRNSALGYTTPAFAGAAPRFIACSIKASFVDQGQYFWSLGTVASNRLFALSERYSSQRLVITSWAGNNYAMSNPSFEHDNWHVFIVSYDAEVAKVYVDDMLVLEYVRVVDTDSSSGSLIGNLPGYTYRGLLGLMRDFIVYDRVLSDTERQEVYDYMAGKF